MKICRKCKTLYEDPRIDFCLKDGFPLVKAKEEKPPGTARAEEERAMTATPPSGEAAPEIPYPPAPKDARKEAATEPIPSWQREQQKETAPLSPSYETAPTVHIRLPEKEKEEANTLVDTLSPPMASPPVGVKPWSPEAGTPAAKQTAEEPLLPTQAPVPIPSRPAFPRKTARPTEEEYVPSFSKFRPAHLAIGAFAFVILVFLVILFFPTAAKREERIALPPSPPLSLPEKNVSGKRLSGEAVVSIPESKEEHGRPVVSIPEESVPSPETRTPQSAPPFSIPANRPLKATTSQREKVRQPDSMPPPSVVPVPSPEHSREVPAARETAPMGATTLLSQEPSPAPVKITVTSTPPGATVYIDRLKAGETPTTVTVNPGEHRITLEKKGYVAREKAFNTREVPSVFDFRLIEAPSLKPSRMVISSNPIGAQVYVNGQAIGRAPLTVSLSPGLHLIRVEKEGYVTYLDRITIEGKKEGETEYLEVDLTKSSTR